MKVSFHDASSRTMETLTAWTTSLFGPAEIRKWLLDAAVHCASGIQGITRQKRMTL
jgi:hypothetical protein